MIANTNTNASREQNRTERREKAKTIQRSQSEPAKRTIQVLIILHQRPSSDSLASSRLVAQDVLDVGDRPARLHGLRSAWEDGDALLGDVQHRLNVGQNADTIRRNNRVLYETDLNQYPIDDNVRQGMARTLVLSTVAARWSHQREDLKLSPSGALSPM